MLYQSEREARANEEYHLQRIRQVAWRIRNTRFVEPWEVDTPVGQILADDWWSVEHQPIEQVFAYEIPKAFALIVSGATTVF